MDPSTRQPQDPPGIEQPTAAVEFGSDAAEDEEDEDHWIVFAGIAAFCFGVAGYLMVPGTWQEQIVDYDARRFSGVARLLEKFGQIPTVIVLAALGALALVAVVQAFRADRDDASA